MNNEFISSTESLALKELGFNEKCSSFYNHNSQLVRYVNLDKELDSVSKQTLKNSNIKLPDTYTAPTWRQAFNFFRTKYGLSGSVNSSMRNDIQVNYFTVHELKNRLIKSTFFNHKISSIYDTYEECELACLKFLILTVTNQIKELNKTKTNG